MVTRRAIGYILKNIGTGPKFDDISADRTIVLALLFRYKCKQLP